MWSSNLLFAMSLTDYVASQEPQDVVSHGLATPAEPPIASAILAPSPRVQHGPKDAEQLQSSPTDAPSVRKAGTPEMMQYPEWPGFLGDMTDGQTTTFTRPYLGIDNTWIVTVSRTATLDATVTVKVPMYSDPVELHLRGVGDNLVETLFFDDFVFTTVVNTKALTQEKEHPKRTPQTPRPLVTVLKKQNELLTLDPPEASDASIETLYTTVTVQYGHPITSTSTINVGPVSSAIPTVTETITATITRDRFTLDPITSIVPFDQDPSESETAEVSFATTTVYIVPYEIHHEFTPVSSDAPEPDALEPPSMPLSGIGSKVSGWFADLSNPARITTQILLATILSFLVFQLCAGCLARFKRTGKSGRGASTSDPGANDDKSQDTGRRTIHVSESPREGGGRGEQDDANARGTASRRAEEGRSRSGLPGGQPTSGDGTVSSQPRPPAEVIEEVKNVEVGHPATSAAEQGGSVTRAQLDGATGGSVRGRFR